MTEAPTRDGFLGGRLVLRQTPTGHRVGSDAVLLAAAAPMAAGRFADLGCGVGAVGLAILARDLDASALLVEKDAELARLAAGNAAANGFASRCRVVGADLLASGRQRHAAGLAPGSVDLVVSNPPFSAAGRGTVSPRGDKAAAHVMPTGGLAAWIRAATDLLSPAGEIILIHRPEALAELLGALEGRFGGLRLKPIAPRADQPATRLLVRGRKGSRAPLSIAAPLALHGADDIFTATAQAIHRGEALLDW